MGGASVLVSLPTCEVPTVHPLLARALELGVHSTGLTDDEGSRVVVEAAGGVLRCEVRDAAGEVRTVGWRCPGSERPLPGHPDGVPFLPELSWVAVLEPSGLTVAWPAPVEPLAWPGGGMPGVGGGLAGRAGAPDPVAEAWTRYAAEAGGEAGFSLLEEGIRRAVADAVVAGWEVVEDVRLEGPVEGRVVRLSRGDRERSFTLSRALGVSTLVLLEKPGLARR